MQLSTCCCWAADCLLPGPAAWKASADANKDHADKRFTCDYFITIHAHGGRLEAQLRRALCALWAAA